MNATGSSTPLATVHLVGVPTELSVRSLMHFDDLLHELRIVKSGQESGQAEVAPRLARLIDEVLETYSDAVQSIWAQVEQARQEGRDRFDLELRLPASAVDDSGYMTRLLDEADQYCRSEQLLTLAASEDIVALRQWTNEETLAQLRDHRHPTPCPL